MTRARVTVSLLAVAFIAGTAAGGPASFELVRSSIDCGGTELSSPDTGDCGDCGRADPKGLPGCSDPVCQDIVCVMDPYCCSTDWDRLCASEALTACDCPAGLKLRGTIGQSDTGVMTGGDFVLAGGFWGGQELSDPCPWDCGNNDGEVGIVDFLTLLAQWGQVGVSCDIDGSGVGRVDLFLLLLPNWGPCPGNSQ